MDRRNEPTAERDAALRERLARLSQTSLRINESLDFHTVLQGALDSARALTGARYGVMTLMEDRGRPTGGYRVATGRIRSLLRQRCPAVWFFRNWIHLLSLEESECIGAALIGKNVGIHQESGVAQLNDAIATGVLNKLADERRVERCPQTIYPNRGGWELSDAEFNLRRDDVS